MTWQDVALAGANASFFAALVPMLLRRRDPPPVFTCVTTGTGLAVIVAVYASLGHLGTSVAATAACSVGWMILGWDSWVKRGR